MKKVLIVVFAIVMAAAVAGCATTPQAGEVGVVRNGGIVDSHSIRQLVCPNQGLTGDGIGSSVHYYPDSTVQRTYTITADKNKGDQKGVDVVSIPTADGVQVGLEGTFYLTTAFDCSSDGKALVKKFDDKFGVRTFTDSDGNEYKPFEGNAGWDAFLAANVRPSIDSDLRKTIGNFQCADLVASCALVHGTSASAADLLKVSQSAAGGQNSANLQKVQDAINEGLQQGLKNTLGEDYFEHITFQIQKVSLPTSVQDSIDKSQAAFAALASAQAKVTQAKLENDANAELAKQYDSSPALALIKEIESLPAGANVFFGGTNGVTPVVQVGGK